MTVKILGLYWFFCFWIISYELYFCIFGFKIACSLLKLCLKIKCDISKFLPDTIMFLMRKRAEWDNGIKISIFVNQSNINKPEFNLAQRRLKCLENYLANLRLLQFNLTDQSYLPIRLKCFHFLQPYSIITILLYNIIFNWFLFFFS